jgi:hypothetical protein
MSLTSEKAFETHVEEVLLQISGWHPGTNAKWGGLPFFIKVFFRCPDWPHKANRSYICVLEKSWLQSRLNADKLL